LTDSSLVSLLSGLLGMGAAALEALPCGKKHSLDPPVTMSRQLREVRRGLLAGLKAPKAEGRSSEGRDAKHPGRPGTLGGKVRKKMPLEESSPSDAGSLCRSIDGLKERHV